MARDPLDVVLIGSNALMREGLARILSEVGFRVITSAYRVDDSVLRVLPPDKSIFLIVDVGNDFQAAHRQIESFRRRSPSGRIAVLAHQHQLSEMLTAFRAGANAYFARDLTCDLFIKILKLVMQGESIVLAETSSLFGGDHDGLDNDNSSGQQSSINNGRQLINESRPRDDHDDVNDEADVDDLGTCDRKYGSVDDGIGDNASALSQTRSGVLSLSARQLTILKCLSEGDSNKVIARKIAISEATVKVHVKAVLRKIQVHNRTQAAIWALNHDWPIMSCNGNGSFLATKLSSRGPSTMEFPKLSAAPNGAHVTSENVARTRPQTNGLAATRGS
jgi:two-component system, NarL family, nitrate/nitrite response regulator NarL